MSHPHAAAIFLAAFSVLVSTPAPATAEVATPYVRVEGRTMTLFEGPLRADGRTIRSSDDTTDRPCDGTNAGRSTVPGPTPTSLAVDGMRLAGTDFSALWYPGFDDYFITRFGPDEEGDGAYWGVLLDGGFTSVGGCQIKAPTGSEAMWAYDAFNGRPFLQLDRQGVVRTPGQAGFAPTAGTTVALNTPLTLTVRQYSGGSSDNPDAPQNPAPVRDAGVVAVTTAANGFQTPASTGPVTDADGLVSLTFDTPGWHRVKAVKDGFVRSNRLDVCVPATGANTCGALPADALVRDVAPTPTPTPTATPTPSPTSSPQPIPTVQPQTGPLRLSTPTLTRSGSQLRLRFAVLDAGPGLRDWAIAATPLGVKHAAVATPARGTSAGTSTFRLSAGREYALLFTATDASDATTRIDLGTVIAPFDDRAKAIRYRGRTTRSKTHTRLSRNASGTVRLGAGRPILQLAAGSRGTVEIAGRRYAVKGAKSLRAASRAKAGTLRFRVRSGAINLTGIAAGR